MLVNHSNKGKCDFTGELNRDEEQNTDICTYTLCENYLPLCAAKCSHLQSTCLTVFMSCLPMLVLSTQSALLLNGLVNNKAVASFEKLELFLAQSLFNNTYLRHNLLDKILELMVTMSRVVRET